MLLEIAFNVQLLSLSFILQDWDQVSAYSGRSIPRPRMYTMENPSIADDLRSHVSHFSAMAAKGGKARLVAYLLAL